MATVAIIGGGISGLSAAHYLRKFQPLSANLKKIILLEASDKFGGWMQTTRLDNGAIFEQGPRTIRGAGPSASNTFDLIEDLKLETEMLPITPKHPAAHKRMIYHNNTLHQLPSSFRHMFSTAPPLTTSIAKLVASELFQPKGREEDETIHSFFSRRLGKEMAELLVDPMCRGIFAGATKQLSIKSCFKDLYEAERNYGSLVMSALRSPKPKPPTGDVARTFQQNRWGIWSMEEGLGQIVHTLRDSLNAEDRIHLHTNKPCTKVEFQENKAMVYSDDEVFEVDHVISTCLSSALAPCLPSQHDMLSDYLSAIPSVSVAVVNLEYSGDILPFKAFGHLVPSFEPTAVMGVIYDSMLFPKHNSQTGTTSRTTVMMGGAWYEQHFGDPSNPDKDEIAKIATEESAKQLGLSHQPITTIVNVHQNCIPQYIVGHSRNLGNIENYIEEQQLPLTVTGCSYRGVSINDIIFDARRQVENLVARMKKGDSATTSNIYL